MKQSTRPQFPEQLSQQAAESREYGGSSRTTQAFRSGQPQNFEEEFLTRGAAGPQLGLLASRGTEVPESYRYIMNAAREEARQWTEEYLNRREDFDTPRNYISVSEFEKFQKTNPGVELQGTSAPEETFVAVRTNWKDQRDEKVRSIRDDPVFQEFTEHLIRNSTEGELLDSFKRAREYRGMKIVPPDQYLELLAYENITTRNEFLGLSELPETNSLNYGESLFRFLKILLQVNRRLDPVLEADTIDFDEKMRESLYNMPVVLEDLARRYGIGYNTTEDVDGVISFLIHNRKPREEILEMLDDIEAANNPISRIRSFLENDKNYSLEQLKKLAKGYGAVGRTRKELIENILEKTQAQNDLREMIERPESQWIAERELWKNGETKSETLRSGGKIWYSEKGLTVKIREPSGLIREFYRNGKIKGEVVEINGKKEGSYKSYYSNGNTQTVKNYKNGLGNGLFQRYSYDGNLEMEGHYEKDEQSGFWTYLDEEGIQEIEYFEDGIQWKVDEIEYHGNGEVRNARLSDVENSSHTGYMSWYPNGDKETEMIFIDNDENRFTNWYSNGNMRSQTNYANGEMSRVTNYFENGQLQLEGQYGDGKRTGIWRTYDEEGNLTSEINYSKNIAEELTTKESRDFWKQYNLVLKDLRLISKLVEEIPGKDSTIYAPVDFDILRLEEDLVKGKPNRYLPAKNPKSFAPVVARLKEIYYRPLPEKSLL